MYLYCLTCVSRRHFTFTSNCFTGVLSTIIVLVFLAFFIAIHHLASPGFSLSIMLKVFLTLWQYDCVICISDVCDIFSIHVYSLSIIQCFYYQAFRVGLHVKHTQYTTLPNASLYCNFFRCFIFVSHCVFLLDVNMFD